MPGIYEDNLRLGEIEYRLQHIYLRSWPRCLGIVLGNRCNIGCLHCYQSKNGDNLLRPLEIGQELRREFIGLYPYLSTLRLQGGELFVIPGFRELLEDVNATVKRPIVSISTNATVIDEQWAETIVRTPFQNVTISLDAATPATYARLRRGATLDSVLSNIQRIQRWKKKLGSVYPVLDSFFVVMRSNFREIPRFLDRMNELGIRRVAFQTMHLNRENQARVPSLAADECMADHAEVVELHSIIRQSLCGRPPDEIQTSGLTTLFEKHNLDGAFLKEKDQGLYPDSDGLQAGTAESGGFDLCPNPWTTLFVTEAGDVHLCFLSEPVGNIYQEPLSAIWNSQQALAKRSRMAGGNYLASGCSREWCAWRERQQAVSAIGAQRSALLRDFQQVIERAARPPMQEAPSPSPLAAVRRMLLERDRRIAELEALFQQLCSTNQGLHEQGQAYIDHLEAELTTAREGLQALTRDSRAPRRPS